MIVVNKYHKKPLEVEAVQFLGERDELQKWIEDNGGHTLNWFFDGSRFTEFLIFTLEGNLIATYGDYIIRGTKGEFYPCKPDIFVNIYEIISDYEVVSDEN